VATVTSSPTRAPASDPFRRHDDAVARLRDDYAALPPGAPVRLAKPTTNLFRFRDPAAAPGLDVSDFNRVLHVDPDARTADVQGMTTYEDLVAATLPHGLMPLVVPQLKTITLGGAVTGLGIESASFRNGLPHESVLEMQILTGDGQIVTADPDGEHRDLFHGFPNSYGTLGYTLRLKIELEPVEPYVRLRHIRFQDAQACMAAIAQVCADAGYDGERADFVDGVSFEPGELYMTLGTFTSSAPWLSDYTGSRIFYRSLQRHRVDYLTVHDYLWRWDTDWFWCSRAFGVQHPVVRAMWPRRYQRSDVYRRFVAFDHRHGLMARVEELRGHPPLEKVIQDIEVPVDRGARFLDFFHSRIGMRPVWMCPLRLRRPDGTAESARNWPLYPLDPETLYVNFGFWGTVPLPDGRSDGYHNRLIEDEVSELGGHKSLYSTAFYSQDEFWRLYNGPAYQALKRHYDADGRLLELYDKTVRSR